MAKKAYKTVYQRRKREEKTDYKKRLFLLKSGQPRLVVRRSLKNINAQIITFTPEGDKVEVSANSRELAKNGWQYNKSNLPAAYLIGYMVGKKALKKNIKKAILDVGLTHVIKGSKLFAVLKGAVDAGLEVPHSPDVLPPEERITGQHIIDYAGNAPEKQFSGYKKKGVSPAALADAFNKIKEKL